MPVILTEKPSVARDIAKCLQVNNKHDGYIDGNGYQITWAFGHLVELKEPAEYHKEWKRWSLESLPLIPEKFGLKARGDDSAKKQLKIIKGLFKNADEIICATDAGREGELIFRYILSWAQCLKKPVKRLWISSMTDESIKKGFANLQDGKLYEPLYRAAKCRSESDWIVGLNSTRFYTLKYGQNKVLWSIGRVQTPILALIVNRDLDILNFIPKDFWELQTKYRETIFQYVGGRFDEEDKAKQQLEKVKDHEFEIIDVKGKQEKVNPPLLFDLTDLQKEMSKRHGFTADQTLNCTQQLYEKKHVTYPRTDSRFLTSDMKSDMKPLLEKLKANYTSQIKEIDLEKLDFNKRIFNDAKVSDHHAIIPTKVLPGSLAPDESKVYHAIVLRYISSFYPPCLKQITTVFGETNHLKFKATGTIIKSLGWQALYKNEPEEEGSKKEKEQKILPAFEKGEKGDHVPTIKKGKTSPPKHFNEATLLTMMETAGKTCDDEELREALKEKGLGTPATRASIIEILIKRKYICRQKKNILSTDSGKHLISIISDDRLKSPDMTGEWESKLKKIEQSQYDAETFMKDIIDFTKKIKEEASKPVYDQNILGNCPLCQNQIIEGKKGYGCSDWKNGCKFVLWKEIYGLEITTEIASQLLQNKQTVQFYMIKVNDITFDAQLRLTSSGDVEYTKIEAQTRKHAIKEPIAPCPLCNGSIVETEKAYGCSEWRTGCKMVIWKTMAQKKITLAMAKKLITKGETGILKGFKSKKGNDFEVNLKLIDGKVEMDFLPRN